MQRSRREYVKDGLQISQLTAGKKIDFAGKRTPAADLYYRPLVGAGFRRFELVAGCGRRRKVQVKSMQP